MPGYVIPKVTFGDVLATSPGVYEIAITLEQPATHTVFWRWTTMNGTAIEGLHYEVGRGVAVFQPGERVKHAAVRVLRPLAPGEQFTISLVGYPGHPPVLLGDPIQKWQGGVGNIAGYPTSIPPETNRPIRLSRPQTLAYEETFGPAFIANDTGVGPGGQPCWVSRLPHGRTQPNNREICYYADPALQPGTKGFGRDANGFFVQAEYLPAGVKGRDGKVMTYKYDKGPAKPYKYAAGVVTTERMGYMRRGDFIEVRARLPKTKGAWPAIWISAIEHWTWPAIELDLMEGFFGAGYDLDRIGTTTHWKDMQGEHRSFGLHGGIIKAALPDYDPLDFHSYGCHIGADMVTFTIDGIAYMQVPNMFPDLALCLILNVAIEGHEPDPAQFPARMYLQYARVFR